MLKRCAAILAAVALALSVGAVTVGCEERHEPQIPEQQMPAPRQEPMEREEMPRPEPGEPEEMPQPQPDDQPLIPQQ